MAAVHKTVSVIIPSYNQAQYIGAALESALSQTFTDHEIIVVDDGSTDATEAALRPYMARISYIRKENGGPGSARNTGIRKARGRYLAFLDSDDIWLPEKLEVQVNYLDKRPHVALVFSDAVIFREEGGEKAEVGKMTLSGRDVTFSELFKGNFIPNLTVVVRKSCIDTVGQFDESDELRGGEDYDMWLRIARSHRLGHLPLILARYREHAQNLVGIDVERSYRMYWTVIHNILRKYPEIAEELDFNVGDFLHNWLYHTGRALYERKTYHSAAKYLKSALACDPFAPRAVLLYLMSLVGSACNRVVGNIR